MMLFLSLDHKLKQKNKDLDQFLTTIFRNLREWLEHSVSYIHNAEQKLKAVNPLRQLELGYSIVSFQNKIIKSVKLLKKDDKIDVKLKEGELEALVNKIIK